MPKRTAAIGVLAMVALATSASADLAYKKATTQNDKKGKWEAKATYVQFQGGSALAKSANASIRAGVGKRLQRFVKSAGEATVNPPYQPACWFDETPTVHLAKPTLLSVVTQVSSYEGGAHGYTYPVFDNWCIVGGKPTKLRLQDLLIRGQKDVEAVSTLVMGKLAKIDRADWVQDGTVRELDKDTENSFTITSKGLRYTFAFYVMGSYALGPIDVELSWAELKGLVDLDGPLKPLFVDKAGGSVPAGIAGVEAG